MAKVSLEVFSVGFVLRRLPCIIICFVNSLLMSNDVLAASGCAVRSRRTKKPGVTCRMGMPVLAGTPSSPRSGRGRRNRPAKHKEMQDEREVAGRLRVPRLGYAGWWARPARAGPVRGVSRKNRWVCVARRFFVFPMFVFDV